MYGEVLFIWFISTPANIVQNAAHPTKSVDHEYNLCLWGNSKPFGQSLFRWSVNDPYQLNSSKLEGLLQYPSFHDCRKYFNIFQLRLQSRVNRTCNISQSVCKIIEISIWTGYQVSDCSRYFGPENFSVEDDCILSILIRILSTHKPNVIASRVNLVWGCVVTNVILPQQNRST